MNNKSKFIKNALLISLLAVVILNFYYLSSLAVMIPYNKINYLKSFVSKEKIEINIPEEKSLDWYPLMNFYSAEDFSKYINSDVDLGIYYKFGEFRGKHSDIFRPDSKTYSSFYGAYILNNKVDEEYLVDGDGNLIIQDIIEILIYDYEYLVLKPMGYRGELKVDFSILDIDAGNLSAEIEIRGLSHNYKKFNTNYIQYGRPNRQVSKNFEKIKTYGKFKIEKPTDNLYIVYYIINQDKKIVESWGVKWYF